MSKLKEAVALIRELSDLLEESSLSEIEVEGDELRIRVARQAAPVAVTAPAAAPPSPQAAQTAPVRQETPAEPETHPGAVLSPMVGTVYVAPEPGAPAFVSVGSTVNEGDTLLIVEAMKVMNPIPAPRAGVITRILVTDAQPVEYGEPLMIIE